MKRASIICIAALLLMAAGSLIIYKNHLRVEADMVAGFNESQLALARLIGRGAELIVDDGRHKMAVASWIISIIKGNEKCLASMEAVYNNLKEKNINLLFRLNDRGILTHYVPEDKLKGVTEKDFSFRECFKEVKRTGRPFISRMLLAGGEEYVGVEGRFKTVFIAVPLYNNGKFAGVLGASLDLASLFEKSIRVGEIKTGRTEYCWAIDDRGVFIAHPIKEFIGRNAFAVRKEKAPDISFEEIDRIVREKMMKGKEGTDSYINGWHGGQKGKIKKLIAYAPFYLDGRQYSVALATPEREVILLGRKNLLNSLLTMAIIAVIGLFGLLYVLSLDRRRVEGLEREASLAEEIKESRDYLQNLLETANDLIYTVDINGNFTYLNPRVEDYGYTPDELMGKRFLTILSEKHRGGRFEKSIREKVRQMYEVELKTKEGAIRICRISTSPLMDQEGTVIGLIATVRDITERERLTEEVREKNKELANFVYTISHDMKAPVISIQGFSSILLADFQDKLDDTGKRYLARIHANVRQMEILIDDLLEFSRIGKVAGTFEDVSSVEIIKDVLNVLGPQLKKRGVKVNVQGNLPVIHCDRNRIYRVFENLIQNSVKYMGDADESPVIEVGCRETDGFHEFYVKDNGIGIDPAYHRKIFLPFQRLNEVDAKGTGIGLAIVERIAGIHGGSVRVESERGKGAAFFFSVPEKAGR